MTRLEMVNLILGRLGNRSGATLATQVVAELQFRQMNLEQEGELPWFLLEGVALTINNADPTVDLPTGFLKEFEDDSFFIITSEGKYRALKKRLVANVFADEEVDESQEPFMYHLTGLVLEVRPIPDQAYTGRFYYYKADAVLSADGTTNKWSTYASDLLVAEAGFNVARYLRDFNASQMFQTDIGDARRRILAQNVARKQAGYEAFVNSGDE